MSDLDLLPDFVQRIRGTFGGAGDAWLVRLPALVAACAQQWDLVVGPPFPDLSYNYVAPAGRGDGTEAVLKLGVPNPELTSEIEALRLYGGRGSVQLLAADEEKGALLLERLRPGTMLSTLADDEEATAIAARVMGELWQPAPAGHSFPTVEKWAVGGLERLRAHFGGGTGPFPAGLVATAEGLFAELLAGADEPVLLHGDLHHYNILAAQRQPWLALDPKGVVGEAAYEVGAYLRNPMPAIFTRPGLKRVLARRIDQFAAMLDFDRERLVGWGLAQAVLSAWWSYEDGDDWDRVLVIAEALNEERT